MVVVGVDVGGTKIAGAVADRECSRRASITLPTPTSAPELLETLVDVVQSLMRDEPEPVAAVGVGLPSLIDQASGRVRFTANIDLAEIDVVSPLTEALGVPVVIDNDGNLAALAEHRLGAARGHDDAILLALGTGVGGGIVAGGRLLRGGRGTGAEVGHVVVDADGPPCQRNCPNRGCLETMASGTAIARDAGMRAEHVVERARTGDADATRVLDRAGRYLGVGMASLANLFNPSIFVMGGGVSAAGELILGPARDEYRARALRPNAEARVAVAELGPAAGVVGAALLAWERVDGT